MLKKFADEPIMELSEIRKKYPDTKYVVRIKSVVDTEGALIAVSESPDSFAALIDVRDNLQDNATNGELYGLFGSYNNGGAIGVQYEVRG